MPPRFVEIDGRRSMWRNLVQAPSDAADAVCAAAGGQSSLWLCRMFIISHRTFTDRVFHFLRAFINLPSNGGFGTDMPRKVRYAS